jgi:hypothetical protein
MGWRTTECPLPQVDTHHCDARGCIALARVQFLSIERETNQRRESRRCDAHAEEIRATIEKRRAAPVGSAPKPAPADPMAPAEPPKRKPPTYPIPDGAAPTTCSTCGETIFWILTPNMKRCPVEAFGEHRGESHFAHCPQAAQHSRKNRKGA